MSPNDEKDARAASTRTPSTLGVRWLQATPTSTVFDPEAAPVCPTTRARGTEPKLDVSLEATLIAILQMPVAPGETIAVAFARKEASLRHAFATLDVDTSRALHARLSSPKEDDPLATCFMRLLAERRARLLDFLADVRRRLTVASRGRR